MTNSTPGLFAAGSLGQFAEKWARGIAEVLEQEFPAVNMHISTSAADCDVRPRTQHPSFWGCFDWHSSVHMQYSAVRLLAEEEISPEARKRLHNILEQRWDKHALQVEYDYLLKDPSFEQPYGRAWLLQLVRRAGREEFLPLVELTEKHVITWVSALSHPIRHGMHYNTAFNLFLMLDAAEAMGRGDLAEVLADAARKLFLDDRDYPLEWELSGSDFLSNALCEMLLLSRVLKKTEFSAWLENFLPVQQDALNFLTYTPEVLDPSDGQLAHLYGLTLSRAWMLRELAPHLDQQAQEFIAEHTPKMLASVEKQLVDGDFMATHWLITYALLAIRADQ
ncbi:DUF2891 family protein [Corynebacterium pseudodiphtheriticum]|uniref:DUF2891 family protein n=1 Tax=Corynebacterium pseudodiphtheriticum TaxID=37637 RepID=UPI001EF5FF9C|nr:DUF2891 family protein [Corynebacterium pseudodiphtheriticum]MCG7252850.1 DUF2891 domain-containing protein [Corynebacterium pseudodiphtheriticum]MDK4339942.1 DUF2891 family protein [Corynebacterium pseudodiphtheriticum]